jgi:tetratricopeptide (TPR) repeat protein
MAIEKESNKEGQLAVEHFQNGLDHFIASRMEAARQEFERVLEFDPYFTMAYCYLSSIYTECGDPGTGEGLARRGISIDPDNLYLRFCLGRALDRSNQPEEALKQYNHYFQSNQLDTECLFCMAVLYDQLEQEEQAEEFYKRTIDLERDHYRACLNLALLFQKQNRYREGISYLCRAVEAHQGYWKAWVKLGIFYSKVNDPGNALKAYEKAAELKPELHSLRYNIGLSNYSLKRFEAAAEAFRIFIGHDPNDLEAWQYLGLACIESDQWQAAEEAFQYIVGRDLEQREAHLQLGRIFCLQREFDRARKELEFLESRESPLAIVLRQIIADGDPN